MTTKSTILGALVLAACLTMTPSASQTVKAFEAGVSPAPVQTVGYWRYRRPYYGYRAYRPNYGYGYGGYGYGYRSYYRPYYRPYGYGYGYRGYGPGFGVGVY